MWENLIFMCIVNYIILDTPNVSFYKCIGLRMVIVQMCDLIHWSQNCFQFLSKLKPKKNIVEKPMIFFCISLITLNMLNIK